MTARPPARPDWTFPLRPPVLIAHRGGAALFPENTLEAFQAAAERYGCRFMELDVHATRDGIPVVIHDATVERTTDGAGAVRGLTLADLQRLDAAHRFRDPQGARWPAPCRVPTLEAVLAALPECLFSIDVKQAAPPCEAAVAAVIRRRGMERRVLLGAESGRAFRRIRRVAPDLPSFFTRGAVLRFLLWRALRLPPGYRPPHHTLQIPERAGPLPLVTPGLLADAHRLGLPVLVWTVNEEEDMLRLLRLGVDGLMTDRPDRFVQAVARLGTR